MKQIILATMGEVALKGQNRKSFEAMLLKNTVTACRRKNGL